MSGRAARYKPIIRTTILLCSRISRFRETANACLRGKLFFVIESDYETILSRPIALFAIGTICRRKMQPSTVA